MKSRALGRKLLACVATLAMAAVPLIYTACGNGVGTTLGAKASQQSSAPTVTAVVPNTGPAAGGTVVTLKGSNFTSGGQATPPGVSFGGQPATNVTVLSSSQLSAQVPAHAAGNVGVQVITGGGETAALANAFTYTTTAALSVNSVSPSSGPAAGGTTVTISGSGFRSGVSVTFGGLAATKVSLTNSSTIVAVTPVHSAGSATVTITNSSGDSANLTSGFGFHSIDLLWNAPSSSPVTIAGYNIYRGNTSAGPFGRLNGSSPLSTTSYTDTTTQGGTTYYYEVKSVDTNGVESPPAGPVTATTTP